MNDPDEIDAQLRDHLDGDDLFVRITAYQAMKVGSIIGALARGHEGWSVYLPTIEKFLQLSAVSARGGVQTTPSLDSLWQTLNALPWPPQGGPKPQTDA